MKSSACVSLPLVLLLLLTAPRGGARPAFAQSPVLSSPNSIWVPASTSLTEPDNSPAEKGTQSNLSPQKDWPSPVGDQQRFFFFLADLLEYSPHGQTSDFRWDIQGWYGGDFNKLWYKTEGTRSDRRNEYDLDFQLLYSRFLWNYWDFQIGGRVQTAGGRNMTRGFGVISLEGLVPYDYEIEPELFISQDGDVSASLKLTKDLLLTQKLILQARFETSAAIQKVEKWGVGRGLNDIELGLRLRYEIRREVAPYIGVSYEQSVGGTAGLVRREGGDTRRVGFVAGVRLWW